MNSIYNSNINVFYEDFGMVTTFSSIATNSLMAYRDVNNNPISLAIGSSKNMYFQAINDINFNHGLSNAIILSTTTISGSNAIQLEYLNISASNGIQINDTQNQGITIESSNLIVHAPTWIQDSLTVSGYVATNNPVVTPQLSLYASSTKTNIKQVGFSFQIDDQDRLVLTKYSFFENSSNIVSKRVAMFGACAAFSENDTSDINIGTLYNPVEINSSIFTGEIIANANGIV